MVPRSQLDGRIVTSPAYETDIGPHVFPTGKYRGVRERLEADGLTGIVEPEPPDRQDLLRVHTAAYMDDLAALRWTPRTWRSEIPISEEIVRWFELSCGGTTTAARLALTSGWAAHLGGGFHHAFADRAEGFCYLNDLAVGARALQSAGEVERVAVIDVDVHQGNGTAAIFAADPTVFTFSIHQEDNYPVKERSDLDIGLLSFDRSRPGSPYVTDDLYLGMVESALPRILDDFRPDLVLYQAGADPYERDRLGGFRLTREGLARRDATVIGACRECGVPVAITLGGGYAEDVVDTVAIHAETVAAAARLDGAAGDSPGGKRSAAGRR